MIIIKFNFLIFLILFLYIGFIFYLSNYKIKNIFLRILIIFLLTLILLEIVFVKKDVDKLNLAVLIDNSYSMKFNNRLEKVRNFIIKNYKELSKKFYIDIYSFNENLIKVKDINDLKYEIKKTKINNILEKFLSENKNHKIILLFSDGINNTEDLPDFNKEEVFIIPISFDEKNFKDISISNLRYSNFGFKDIEQEIRFDVLSYGYNNKECNIEIVDFETKKVIISKNFKIKENKNEIKLLLVPSFVGKNRYLLNVQQFEDEITYENNTSYFEIDVKKNKIRVLYICGQPSSEYFHLRNLLKNNNYIDLVSFVILRDPNNIAIAPDEDLSLIPFPSYDIFVKELFNYDVLIFENFSYKKFNIPVSYLENIRNFVSLGGGFIMIGGENSFFLGGYKETPIEDILPVILSDKEKFIYLNYKPEVVDYKDKFVNINIHDKESIFFWREIPEFGNYQLTYSRVDANVILKYKEHPIMCYRNFNKGRVFVSLTNTTWRWKLGNVRSQKYNYKDFYRKFWNNIIYWCAGVDDLEEFKILVKEEAYVGEEIFINIITTSADNDFDIHCYINYPNGKKEILEIEEFLDNSYRASFIADLVGRYEVDILIKKNKEIEKIKKHIFVSQINYQEVEKLKPDIEYLSKIANKFNQPVILLDNLYLNDIIFFINKNFPESLAYRIEIYKSTFLGFIILLLFLSDILLRNIKK